MSEHGAEKRKNIILTGTGRGIGAVIQGDLASKYNLISVSRKPDSRSMFSGNLEDPEVALNLLEYFQKKSIALDGLIHCPGSIIYTDQVVPEWEIWNRLFIANVQPVVHLLRILEPLLVNTSVILFGFSGNDTVKGYKNIAAYAAAKNALAVLARSAAIQLASKNTRVNIISPGIFCDEKGIVPEKGRVLRTKIPLKRFGQAGDISGVMTWLLSPGSSYITGQVIKVTGGLHIL